MDTNERAMRARIGELIGESYTARGLSRNQFAERSGVAVGTLYGVEHGKSWPQQSTLRKITDALGWAPRIIQQLLESGKSPADVSLRDVLGDEWASNGGLSSVSDTELAAELSMRVLMLNRKVEDLQRQLESK